MPKTIAFNTQTGKPMFVIDDHCQRATELMKSNGYVAFEGNQMRFAPPSSSDVPKDDFGAHYIELYEAEKPYVGHANFYDECPTISTILQTTAHLPFQYYMVKFAGCDSYNMCFAKSREQYAAENLRYVLTYSEGECTEWSGYQLKLHAKGIIMAEQTFPQEVEIITSFEPADMTGL